MGGARALVLGLGVSGAAAARLLLREGYDVSVVDASHGDELAKRAAALCGEGAYVILDAKQVPAGDFELCVVSPGVAYDSDWSRKIVDSGMQAVSELELGFRYCRCPIVAVTGTNGKSTLVKLCSDILEAAGLRVEPAGNYGIPICDVAGRSGSLDWLVVEVSSFQLEWPGTLRPRVGVLLNIQPDHLDRHGDMGRYCALKTRLFANMSAGDYCLVPESLSGLADSAARQGAHVATFGDSAAATYRYGAAEVSHSGAGAGPVGMGGTYFDNPVMGLAAAAALGVADACGVEGAVVEQVFKRFEPLPHRMQRVGVYDGVTYIDDSKATNLAALAAALRMTSQPVHLIAGGLLKEKDLDCVKEVLAKHVSRIYLVGDSVCCMSEAWEGVADCHVSGTVEQAVAEASASATSGTTVLLSPGCASFDQFRGYRERGEHFQKLVKEYCEEK